MSDKIRILIADDIQDTRALIMRLLSMSDRFEVVGEAANGRAVLEFFEQQDADLVLMDINMPIMNGLDATKQLMLIRPDVVVVIMSVQSETEYLKQAMRCGAKEYIIKPFNFETLSQTLMATYDDNKTRLDATREVLSHLQPAAKSEAIIHCIFSGKGSVGKTFLTTRLAWHLSQVERKRVLLIDGDLQYGDLGLALGLKLSPNIGELNEDPHPLSYDLMQNYLQTPFENCFVLLAPSRPDAAEGFDKESIEALIMLVRPHYDVILIDLGVNYGEATLTFLDLASSIHLVTIPTISALHHSKIALEVMRSLNYEKSKVPIVLNLFEKHCGFTTKEIEQVLNSEIRCVISEEPRIVTESLNKGDVKWLTKGLTKPRLIKQIGDYAKTML